MTLGIPSSVAVGPVIGQVQGLGIAFARLKVWETRFKSAVIEGLRDWAKYVEKEMQTNARWTDRTGHARAALRAYVAGDDPRVPDFATVGPPSYQKNADDQIVVITGFMAYNYWLETRWGGRFSIMWPTAVNNNSRLIDYVVTRGRKVT